MKLATNGSAGLATSSAAVPRWRMRPSTMHADVVGESGGVFEVVGDEDRRQREVA